MRINFDRSCGMRNVEDYIISSGINKMDMHIVQVTRKGMHRNFNLKSLICLISHKINCLFHTWMHISLINLRNDRLDWYLQEETKTTITLNINQPLNFVLMVIQECSVVAGDGCRGKVNTGVLLQISYGEILKEKWWKK